MKTLKIAFFALAFAGILTACQTETEAELEAPVAEPTIEPAPVAPVDTMVMDTTMMMDTTMTPAETL